MRLIIILVCLLVVDGPTAWAAPQDPPDLPRSAIPKKTQPAVARPNPDKNRSAGDDLNQALSNAQTATRDFASQRQDRLTGTQKAAPLATAIEAAYKRAAQLADKYAKDPAIKRCTPRGRFASTADLLTTIVRPPEDTSGPGGETFRYVYPGTENRHIGGSNLGGYNAGGLRIGGGSSGGSDPGGSLAQALVAVRSAKPSDAVWPLRVALHTLTVIKNDLTAFRADTADESRWRSAAIQSVTDVQHDVAAATQMARTLYLEDEQKLPRWQRKLREMLNDKP